MLVTLFLLAGFWLGTGTVDGLRDLLVSLGI